MTNSPAVNMREKLKACNLPPLFIEELGWNHHRATPLVVQNDGVNYVLNAIAEKHGMVAYECQPGPAGQIPDYPTRGKIERQVAKSAHEHLVVFVDRDRTMQTWQWVRREKGKPTARREHTYVCAQPGDSLIQKLQNLMISLEEEDKLTIVDVTGKVRQAFDVDRVTKRFFDSFKKEHDAFLSFIDGITAVADREWYASLMLNRLMFIYFIQKKRFLDGDDHYLRNRLQIVQQSQGKGKFHTFYRYFLRHLFHEGLAQREADRKPELKTLLGNVPYLNGGLFDTHQLENDNPAIHIPDEAFERLFDFFDAYQWHLDERPTRADNEINPDVLGYIFEKYINQKQMGAYYTKEDITDYISKSTIVPFLFDAAEKKCAIAFRPEGAVWRLLRDDPDRYIYDAVKKGVDLPLPDDIAAGVTDVSKRGGWNRPANEAFALPTETWREHVARGTRCLEVRAKLAAGEVHSINDLITYNLDLRQFAQDVIETSEGPDLLRAFYKSIEEISVLDPTCGSGAFLFAALNILEPLYEACLERMEVFVEELDKSGLKHHPEKFSDFRKVLEQANDRTRHPSRRYFILKSIVLKNLYGVDIMAEAVEICKLRLFLKLVAQVERVEDVEPLPDIDFNIRAGNTLVGFTSLEAVRSAMNSQRNKGGVQSKMTMFDSDKEILRQIEEEADVVRMKFEAFRLQQTEYGMGAQQFTQAKQDLRISLDKLAVQLDRYLAAEYGADEKNALLFENWRYSYKPFHWFSEFYGIMRAGFDVVIGNPPYKEIRSLTDYSPRGYATLPTKNLYPLVVERSLPLMKNNGRLGMIVLVSSISTEGYSSLQDMILTYAGHYSSFDDRPSRLFEGLEHIQQTILLVQKSMGLVFTTECYRWSAEERPFLFSTRIHYIPRVTGRLKGCMSKISREIERDILLKLWAQTNQLANYVNSVGTHSVYYSRKVHNFLQALDFTPKVIDGAGRTRAPTELKQIAFRTEVEKSFAMCLLNSSLFRWFVNVYSDCRHVNKREVESFPCDMGNLTTDGADWNHLSNQLSISLLQSAQFRKMRFSHDELIVQAIIPKHSKPIIDEVDKHLANHYGFTEEELDFIINYDIKYRMGAEAETEDEGE